tara:strand:- start:2173 stop:2685 length:513 start_codon:yes stop_codon:yes gene_type:complete
MAIPQYNQNGQGKALDQVAPNGVRVQEAVSKTLTAEESGTIWHIGSGGAVDFVLPAANTANIGVTYTFVWSAAETDAITITTADTTDTTGDMFLGGLLFCAAAAVNTIAQFAADSCKLTFDDNVANTGGGPGTWCEITCIGDAKWFVRGIVEGDSDADGVGSAIASDVDA